jgi:hypothetical protein
MLTDYWFPKVLTARLIGALKDGDTRLGSQITVHGDGDKAMLELTVTHSATDGPEARERIEKSIKLMVIYFIQGFVAAHQSTAQAILPEYVVTSEGRSGYDLRQMNRNGRSGRSNTVTLPGSAIKADAEAALNAAYDGIFQFCTLNGLAYPLKQ